MKRRTRYVALGAVAAAAVVAVGLSGGFPFPGNGDDANASGRGDGLPPATAAVVRTDLVLSKTVDGRIDFAQRRAVKAAVEGTVTVAASEGETVTRGQALYELNDKPVTLLYGPVPRSAR